MHLFPNPDWTQIDNMLWWIGQCHENWVVILKLEFVNGMFSFSMKHNDTNRIIHVNFYLEVLLTCIKFSLKCLACA